ncbi:MAG: metallophosphoesterase [Bacillota bacterium]|nr:metallophosphoesterase [Bacillota bacterium]
MIVRFRLAQAEAAGAENGRRKRVMRAWLQLLLIPFFLLLIVMQVELLVTRRATVALESERLAAGCELRIVQISDYHEFESQLSLRRILRWVAESDADFVAVTGDVLNAKPRNLPAVEALFEGLAEASIPCFFVAGNHDEQHRVSGMLEELFQRTGVRMLDNHSVILETAAGPVRVAGTRDAYSGYAKLDTALAATAAEEASYTVLLTHSPDLIPELEETDGVDVDLVLCGHTHGGQIRLPFVGALYVSGQGWLPRWDRGLFTLENGTRVYVDSGVGWTWQPFRLGAPSQITVVTVRGTG